jgi:RND family efflux transporter MFP subunit
MRHPAIQRLACLAALGAAFCGKAPKNPAPEAAAIRVHTAEVSRLTTGPSSSVPGLLAARDSAEIAARVSATVQEIAVREGERVSDGQLLVLLDQREARAREAAALANEKAARSEQERIEKLFEKRAATDREREQAAAAAQGAKSAVAEARVAMAYLRVAAPFLGRVVSVPVHRGDLVVPGQRLVVVESEGPLELQATIEASMAARFAAGQPVSVKVDGVGAVITGRVRSLSPSGDPETHRFLMRADLPPGPGVRAGLFAAVEVPGAAGAAIVAVPPESLFERGGLTGVFVVRDGKAFIRWVETGEHTGGLVEVRAGLKGGERVVLSPQGLADGTTVEESR